jgi:hypothetical protein
MYRKNLSMTNGKAEGIYDDAVNGIILRTFSFYSIRKENGGSMVV